MAEKRKKKKKYDRKKLKPVRVSSRNSYNPLDKKKVPFLKEDYNGKLFNDTFDVTDVSFRLSGVITGEETIKMKDYLVYRPLPKWFENMRTPPDVHEDSLEMLEYYQKVNEACLNGVLIEGEYYNPFYTFWMLLYVFPVVPLDDDGEYIEGETEINHATYSNIDRYIFDVMWGAYLTRKYVALVSGRGIGKSYFTTSIMMWFYILHDSQDLISSATSEDHAEEAWDKVISTLNDIEEHYPGLWQERYSESKKGIEAYKEVTDLSTGKKEKVGSENDMARIVYGFRAGATKGRRPHFQHVEEFAAFPSTGPGALKEVIGQSKGSWLIMRRIRNAFVVFTGTGGSVNNDHAKHMFMDPEAFNLYYVEEWGGKTGLFIPSHFKYATTWEKYGVPDLNTARNNMLIERKLIEKDPEAYLKECQEFPLELGEVFQKNGTNIFNTELLAAQRTKILLQKDDVPKWLQGTLEYIDDADGRHIGANFIESSVGNIYILQGEEVPYKTDNGSVFNDLYIMGVDSIDQGNADSAKGTVGSKLAVAVKKRTPDGGIFKTTSNLYVAYYNHRSDDVRSDYENVLKLSMFFNSKINLEYAKVSIVGHFRAKGQYHRFIKRPTIATTNNMNADPLKSKSSLIGTPVSTHYIDYQDGKLAEYISDNSHNIWFDTALKQLLEYDRNNRTPSDLVIAMGLCELMDDDLLGKIAKPLESEVDELELFGFYIDKSTGKKKKGIIPKASKEELSMNSEYEFEPFKIKVEGEFGGWK
ncbi:MAG: hypothetical protein KAH32_04635 [Chlamydiia bacterium]|nr:hypothetical protein [Chlamydiia bacterium]